MSSVTFALGNGRHATAHYGMSLVCSAAHTASQPEGILYRTTMQWDRWPIGSEYAMSVTTRAGDAGPESTNVSNAAVNSQSISTNVSFVDSMFADVVDSTAFELNWCPISGHSISMTSELHSDIRLHSTVCTYISWSTWVSFYCWFRHHMEWQAVSLHHDYISFMLCSVCYEFRLIFESKSAIYWRTSFPSINDKLSSSNLEYTSLSIVYTIAGSKETFREGLGAVDDVIFRGSAFSLSGTGNHVIWRDSIDKFHRYNPYTILLKDLGYFCSLWVSSIVFRLSPGILRTHKECLE